MSVRTERLLLGKAVKGIELRRFLPACILAGYGIFILSLFTRHVMTWYINPTYVGPTVIAGAVLIGLAFVRVLLVEPGRATCGLCASEADSCGCETHESSPRLWTYALLSIPLLLALVFPARGLASFSATQRGPQIAGLTTFHGAKSIRRVSLSVDTSSFTLQDWVGALSADPNPRDYRGKPINLTGMVIHNSSSVPPGYIMVLRYQVTCCIADARPVGLVVRDTSGGTLKDNQWVTIRGRMGAAAYQGQKIAVVEPRTIVQVKPGNPYMY